MMCLNIALKNFYRNNIKKNMINSKLVKIKLLSKIKLKINLMIKIIFLKILLYRKNKR